MIDNDGNRKGGRAKCPYSIRTTQPTMRKIETLMNQAISNLTDWKLDNTEVAYYSGHDISRVYLHNNLIAEIGPTYVQLFDGGYQTPTTKSRLNAILQKHGAGERIFSKNFQWFLVTTEGQHVPFSSGMHLI
jgi:hypothetical protein